MRRPKANKPASSVKPDTKRAAASSLFSGRARRVSATAIILLALWGGGFGCLWCCASDLSEGGCAYRSAATVHSAPPACSARRRCCEPTEGNQRAAIKTGSQTAAAHCCPLGTHANGPAAFPSSHYLQALAVAIHEAPAPVPLTFAAPPLASAATPANKGSTYLRCCVLLI